MITKQIHDKRTGKQIGALEARTTAHNGQSATYYRATWFAVGGDRTSCWDGSEARALQVVHVPYVLKLPLFAS
jgi:hypothetical protein